MDTRHCASNLSELLLVPPILPAIADDPYLRVFEHNGKFYGIVRLGRLAHTSDPMMKFEVGPSPFRDTPYNNQVRHVALFKDGDALHVFLPVIGASPEKIVHTTIALKGDWKEWKLGAFDRRNRKAARVDPGTALRCE